MSQTTTALPKRSPTKSDIAMAEVQGKYENWNRIAEGISWALRILASTAPAWMLYRAVEVLAGKQTGLVISATIGITIALTLTPMLVTLMANSRKSRKQRDELIRLRQRVSDLEEQLKAKA